MKALLILLLIYVNYALTANETKYSLKIYPKKVKPGNLQVINAGKYKKGPTKYAKKEQNGDTEYTVFPLERPDNRELKVTVNRPPYFSPDLVESKTRVKKVLPDYIWSLRRKRAAVSNPKTVATKVQAASPKAEVPEAKAKATKATRAAITTKAKPKVKPKGKASAAPTTNTKKTNAPKAPVRSAAKKNSKPAAKPKGGKVTKAKPQTNRNSNKQAARAKKGAKPKPRGNKPARTGNSAKGKKQNKRKGKNFNE